MRKFSRRIPYFLAYWFTLALLLQWTSVVVIADPEDGEPTGAMPAELPTIPPMDFQPPPDADSLSDFIPPESVVITATVDLPGDPITPTVDIIPTVDPPISPTVVLPTLPAISDTISLSQSETIESSDSPLSPTVSLPTPTGLPSVTPTTTFPPPTLTPPVTPTTTLPPPPTVEPTVTPPITQPVTIPVMGTVTNVVSFDQGQLAVVIEEDTVAANSELIFTALPVPAYPLTATNAISDPGGSLDLISFQLEMMQDGVVTDSFDKPVRIVLDMRSLTENLNPVYEGNFFLAYADENEPGLWHEVPITVHQESGLISAEVTHFSTWVGGSNPERWNPSLVQPTVSEFSGAATYNYPLDIPPGRNGLQPAMALSYNSRALDGAIQNLEAGDIANGWSLAQVAIMRQGVKVKKYVDLYIYHPDNFSLVLNGVSHVLKPDGNSITNGTIRFYAKDAPGLKVMRYYNASLSTDGLYWVVTTADGTQYRLGYTADSEEYQEGPLWYADPLTNWGKANNRSAIAWNADTVTDPFGNQMQYTYYIRSETESIPYYNSGQLKSIDVTTRSSRLQAISYNYPNTASPLPATNTVSRLTTTPATTITFRAVSDDNTQKKFTDPISHIFIYHNNASTPMKEYRISSEKQQVQSVGCERPVGTPRKTNTSVVTAIRLHTNTDNNINSIATDDMGYALPPVTFDYTSNIHFVNGGSQFCFYFRYLWHVYNGYGGKTTFAYTGDNRDVGNYNYTSGTDETEWPEIGHNYYVTDVRQDDGRNAEVKTTYSYTTPCYDQSDSGVNRCYTSLSPQYGNIAGFATTTVTNYDYNGSTVLNKKTTTFSQNLSNAFGRPELVDMMTGSNVLLSQTDHHYVTESINGIANMFSYNDWTTTTQYDNGVGSPTLSNKVVYVYDPAFQGGVQYGNLTHIYSYDDASAVTPYQTVRRRFYPNVSSNYWAVNKVSVESLYAGNLATLLGGTWFYYDGATDSTTPPTKGFVTRSRAFDPNVSCGQVPGGGGSGCANAYRTIDNVATVDAYGNTLTNKTFLDYGWRTFNSSGTQVYNSFPTQSRTTTIAYDTTYKLYPISVTNPLGQVTNFQIYGFNGVALDGFQKQRGLLRQVTGANGVITQYEYDPFGRLYAVYDGYNFTGFGDTNPNNGDPVSRYLYFDNNWNNAITFLDPKGNKPFVTATLQRPGSYPAPGTSSSGYAFYEQTFYDGFGRPIQNRSVWNWLEGQSNSREIYSSMAYHANGQVNCQTVPYDLAFYSDSPRNLVWPASAFDTVACTSKPRTTTTYDVLGRPDIVTAPDGTTTNRDYLIRNNITLGGYSKLSQVNLFDANGHALGHFTNARGNLVAVREFSGSASPYGTYGTTIYGYDVPGDLVDVWDNANNNTHLVYDAFGRKTAMTDPDMGTWSYSYDAASNLTEQVDANGTRFCFIYDGLDRLFYKRHDHDGNGCASTYTQLAQFIYYASGSGLGQLSEIRWSSSSTQNRETFTYDSLARLTSHTRTIDSRAYTMSYSNFDSFHRPATVTYPNGEVVTTSYDHEGENGLTAGADSLVSNITYSARGQMALLDRYGVADTTYLYHPQNDVAGGGTGDSNYRLKTIQHGTAGTGNPWPDFTYEYDKVGNITRMITVNTDGTDTQAFGYDDQNRLTSAVATGNVANYSHTYAYNEIGNMTNYAGSAYTYSSTHKHAVATANGVTYSYDANGNMTLRNASGTVNDYTQNFNVENELSSVVNNGSTTSFTYDAAGIRVKTVKPNGTIVDTPFPGYEVENPTGTPIIRRTYSLVGQAIATRVSGDPVSTNNSLFFFYSDHLGSTSMLHKPGQSVPFTGSTTRYLPFGGYRGTPPSQAITDRDFTGQRENMELGLLYYNARYYLPGIARFISADTLVPNPTNPQNWNRYSYTNNNPVRFTDPTGHCVIEDDIGGQCTPMPPSSSSSPQTAASTSSAAPMPAISTDPMVTFNAGCDTCTAFTTEEITTIQESATLTGTRWAETLNALHGWSLTPEQAFVLVYGGSVNFLKTGTQCANRCWGETFLRNGDHVIEVYTDANIAGDPNWAIHELGHAFVNTGRGTPILTLSIFQSFEANFPNRPLTDDPHYWDNSPWGFAGGFGTWQRSDKGRASEEFADMYLGWVRNQWAVRGVVNGKPVWTEAGQMRADFMNTYMAEWAP